MPPCPVRRWTQRVVGQVLAGPEEEFSGGQGVLPHGTYRRLYSFLSKGQRLPPMKRVWKREVGREGGRPCGRERTNVLHGKEAKAKLPLLTKSV